ncbi:MAG: hypothetical protein IT204_04895 [Fimbriimonadaceae bacterium]|nr:hypothetical protein [Fimbriimonadaceae bacterium]
MKADPTFDVELYWRVLRRRIWLLLIPVVLLTGILGLGSYLIPNVYRAQAQIVVRPEQDPVKGLAVESQLTQQLGGVIQALGQPSDQKEIYEKLKRLAPQGTTVEAALGDFRDHLDIRRREEQRDLIVDIVYEGSPERYAVEVVNAFADEFQRKGTRLVATSLAVSLEFVDDQLQSYRKRLVTLDEDDRRVKDRLGRELGDLAPLSAATGLSKFVAERLADGDNEIQKLQLEVSSLEAQSRYLRAQLAGTPTTLAVRAAGGGGSAEGELEKLLAETQAKLSAAQLRYTPQHPEVEALTGQLADLRGRLAEVRARRASDRSDVANPAFETIKKDALTAEAQLQFAKAQRDQLVQRNDRLRRVAGQLPQFEEQLRRISDDRAALKNTYDSLLARKQSLELNQNFEEGRNSGRFDVRRAGGLALQPVRPNRKKFLVLGFLAGIFLGISFVLLAEYLDHSVRSPEDLRRFLDAPVLCVLPRAGR